MSLPESTEDTPRPPVGDLHSIRGLLYELRAAQLSQDQVKKAVQEGIVAGALEVAKHPEFSAAFWEQGYKNLANHASDGASQWIGRRILTVFIAAIATASVVWLVKTGALK